MKRFRKLFVLLCCLSASSLAFANTGDSKDEGVVHGYVVDAATRKPVAGVVVSAQSSKSGITKEVATDAAGYFKLKEVPSGEVSIQVDKKGYKNLRKESIALKGGAILKLTIDIYSEKTGTEPPGEFEHPVLRLIDGIL
jgi:hypothetical protein